MEVYMFDPEKTNTLRRDMIVVALTWGSGFLAGVALTIILTMVWS